MGIHDREYYRPSPRWSDSFSQFLASGFVRPMMGALIVVFMIQVFSAPNDKVASWLYLDADAIWPGYQLWRIATYCLVHNTHDLLAFIINCYILWSFGKMIEDEIGPENTAFVFFASTLAGALAFCTLSWLGFHNGHGGCLGAAGGITAIMVLAAWRNPNLSILIFFVLPVQLWVAVAFFVGIEVLIFARAPGMAPEILLAGALVATAYEFSGRQSWINFGGFRNWKKKLFRPKLKVFRDESPVRARRETPVSVNTKREASAQKKQELGTKLQEEEMDRILEKISKTGMHSLSDEEKRFLLKASDRLKNQKKS